MYVLDFNNSCAKVLITLQHCWVNVLVCGIVPQERIVLSRSFCNSYKVLKVLELKLKLKKPYKLIWNAPEKIARKISISSEKQDLVFRGGNYSTVKGDIELNPTLIACAILFTHETGLILINHDAFSQLHTQLSSYPCSIHWKLWRLQLWYRRETQRCVCASQYDHKTNSEKLY